MKTSKQKSGGIPESQGGCYGKANCPAGGGNRNVITGGLEEVQHVKDNRKKSGEPMLVIKVLYPHIRGISTIFQGGNLVRNY